MGGRRRARSSAKCKMQNAKCKVTGMGGRRRARSSAKCKVTGMGERRRARSSADVRFQIAGCRL
jgi:hypothetical protein